MSIVATLIDKARQRAGMASDSALAAQFGVHRQAVSKWRNGDAYPDEEHIVEMALMAGDDPVQWLVAIKAVRADGKAGKAWASLAKRLAAITASISVIALAYFHRDAPAALMAFAPLAAVDPRSLYTLCEIAIALAVVAALFPQAPLLAVRRLRWIWLWIVSCLPQRPPKDDEIQA